MYTLKSFPKILSDLIAKMLSETGLTDINPGSNLMTLLEGIAQEDSQQYIAMLDLISTYNLDTTSGDDLSERAYEFGLERYSPTAATGYVVFGDNSITKYQSKLYANSSAPISGQTYIDIETNSDIASFPIGGGYIIIGRGTNNVERIEYTAIADNGEYQRFTLALGLLNDHATEETVILSQLGDRTIPVGIETYVQSTDLSPQVSFSTQDTAIILDGESESDETLVKCTITGTVGNASVESVINLQSTPFSGATVINYDAFTNGRDDETDQELRDRIRLTIQSLSRGVPTALLNNVNRVESGVKRVVSSSYIEATNRCDPSYIYIDDGTGFEPTTENVGFEEILNQAAGTEQFLVLDSVPVAKAALITMNTEPFALVSGQNLYIEAAGQNETLTFASSYFENIEVAKAEEVAAFINDYSTLIEARTTSGKSKVIIQAKVIENEFISIGTGTNDANAVLGFQSDKIVHTLNLYKNDILLSKDGYKAFISTNAPAGFGFSFTSTNTIIITVDGKTSNEVTVTFLNTDPIILANGGIANLTPTGVAAVINDQGVGISASVNLAQQVVIESTSDDLEDSSIRVRSGIGTAYSTLFGVAAPDPSDVQYGASKDYILNRINGQIELMEPLVALDKITAGSPYSRAELACSNPEPYTVISGLASAVTLAESLRTTLNAHAADPLEHTIAVDNVNFPLASPVSTDLASLMILIAEMMDSYIIHNADAIGGPGAYHPGVQAGNTLTSIVYPTTLALCIVMLNDIKLQYNGHESSATSHGMGFRHTEATTNAVQSQTFIVEVDGTGDQTITFNITSTLSADDMAALINNSSLIGATAFVQNINGLEYLYLRTNRWEEPYGSIEVKSTSTASDLDFARDTLMENQSPTYGYVATDNLISYNLGRDQNITVVLDDDDLDRIYNLILNVAGTVTSASDESHFNASALSAYGTNDFFNSFIMQFDATTATVDLRNLRRIITDFNYITGKITITPSTPPDISAYTVAQAATIVDPVIAFTSNGTSAGVFQTAAIAGLSVGQRISIIDNNSSPTEYYIKSMLGPLGGAYTITLDSVNNDLPAIPSAGDTFVLIPITTENIKDLLNSTVYSSLSIFADIERVIYDDSIQMSTKTAGSDGKILVSGGTANNINYPFINDGTAIGTLKVNSRLGLSSGLPCVITNNSGVLAGDPIISSVTGVASPYNVSIVTLPDISGYVTLPGAEITSPNISFTAAGTVNGTFEVGHIGGLLSAILLANSLKVNYNLHIADAAEHTSGADPNAIASADAEDLASLITLVTDLITTYDTFHDPDAELGIGWSYHAAQEASDHSLASVVPPTDLDECVDRLNDFLTKYNEHDADTPCHTVGGVYPDISDESSDSQLYVGQIITITDTTVGLSLNCSVRDIEDNFPTWTITVESLQDLTGYTTLNNAVLAGYNLLDFDTIQQEGIDGYKYYTGLQQEVQKVIDGDDSDYDTYPGYSAAGTHIEVLSPIIRQVVISVNVTTVSGVSLTSVINSVKTTVSAYINGLGVGNDVLVSEIIRRIKSLTNIVDIEMMSPINNIPISDNEIARISSNSIYVG